MEEFISYKVNSQNIKDKATATEFVKSYFGLGTYVSNYYPNSITVGTSIPRIVEYKSVTEQRNKIVKTMKFPNFFEISYQNTGGGEVQISYPAIEELERRIKEKINNTYRRSERLLLEASKHKLIKIAQIKSSLTPFSNIISKTLAKGEFSYRDIRDLSVYKPQEKIAEYLRFLTELDILRQMSFNSYTEGNLLIAIQKDLKSESEVIDNALSLVLSSNYEYISKYMKINSMMPYLRISNAYYYQAWLADEMVPLGFKDLINSHKTIYPKIPVPSSKTIIIERELGQMADPNVGILKYKDDVIQGENEILNKMTITT